MGKCCRNCQWREKDGMEDYICVNPDSEYAADYIESNHTCDEWTAKEE